MTTRRLGNWATGETGDPRGRVPRPSRLTSGADRRRLMAFREQRGCTGFDGDKGVQVACRVPTGSLKGGKNTTADAELALAA